MEYEIEDDDALFDSSTNPSLDHSSKRAERRPSTRWARDSRDSRQRQKAEPLPEEEEQAA